MCQDDDSSNFLMSFLWFLHIFNHTTSHNDDFGNFIPQDNRQGSLKISIFYEKFCETTKLTRIGHIFWHIEKFLSGLTEQSRRQEVSYKKVECWYFHCPFIDFHDLKVDIWVFWRGEFKSEVSFPFGLPFPVQPPPQKSKLFLTFLFNLY